MKYKIIENPKYTNVLKIGVCLEPDNEPLRFFISSMRINVFPEFLKDAANDEGFTGPLYGLFYYSDLDEVDFVSGDGFQEDEVQVYHEVFGETIIKKNFCDHLLHDYGLRLLETYRNDKSLPLDWASQMEEALKLFSRKLTKKS